MHYGDPEQLNKNILQVVFYKHQILGTKKATYDFTSIQNCKFIHPTTLKNFLKNPLLPEIKEKLKNLPYEGFYLFILQENKNRQLRIINVCETTNKRNKLYFLH